MSDAVRVVDRIRDQADYGGTAVDGSRLAYDPVTSKWLVDGGLVAGSGTPDQYAAIQAQIDRIRNRSIGDPGTREVVLPPGDVEISHPLVVDAPDMTLRGASGSTTRLYSTFGSGPLVLVQKSRAMPTVGASLATGDGNALFCDADGFPGLLLDMEPNLGNLAQLTAFSASVFWKPVGSSVKPVSPLWATGYDYGVGHNCAIGLAETPDTGGLRVFWNGTAHDTAGSLIADDTTYYSLLTWDGTTVKLWLGTPGNTAVNVLSFDPEEDHIPQLRCGSEPMALGYVPAGVANGYNLPYTDETHSRDMWIDGVEFSRTVRQAAAFTCPTTKPVADQYTLLAMNFVKDDPFFVGDRGCLSDGTGSVFLAGNSHFYCLPYITTETQFANVTVRDFQMMGANGASGILTYDAITSETANISYVGSWQGTSHRGTHFASRAHNHSGVCSSVSWLQSGAGNDMTVSAMNVSAGGIAIVMLTAGGSYNMVYPSPGSFAFAMAYIAQSLGVVFNGVGFDDEGQAEDQHHVIISHNSTVTFFGGQLSRISNAGPVIEVVSGGVNLRGAGIGSIGGTELIKFHAQPSFTCVMDGLHYLDQGGGIIPLTTNPEYCLFEQGGVLNVPGSLKVGGITIGGTDGAAGTFLGTDGGGNVTLRTTPIVPLLPDGTTVDELMAAMRTAGLMELSFNPLTLGPVLWLKADVGTKQTVSGAAATADADPVGQWLDQSGEDNHVSQATSGKRPLLKLGVQNGRPAIRFDGVDDLLASAALTWGTSAGTLLVVYRAVITDQSLGAVATGSPITNGEYLRYTGDGKAYARNFRSARYDEVGTHPNDTAAHLYVQTSGASDYKVYLDGSQFGSTQSAAWASPTAWNLGAADPGAPVPAYANIDVLEVLAFDAELSTGDLDDLTAYLNERWDIF